VRAKFPTVYRNYRHACEQGTFSPGDALPIEDNGVLVYNLASQIRPGPDATVELVRAGLAAMFADMATRGIIAVAIPAIGCGIGGLQFDQLLDLLATDVPTWAYVTLIVRPGEFTIPPAMVARP
jgi:O-acetyl-ADP-ribose deacetylase (regulator of RNase III)